jgi:hypothetical protein
VEGRGEGLVLGRHASVSDSRRRPRPEGRGRPRSYVTRRGLDQDWPRRGQLLCVSLGARFGRVSFRRFNYPALTSAKPTEQPGHTDDGQAEDKAEDEGAEEIHTPSRARTVGAQPCLCSGSGPFTASGPS